MKPRPSSSSILRTIGVSAALTLSLPGPRAVDGLNIFKNIVGSDSDEAPFDIIPLQQPKLRRRLDEVDENCILKNTDLLLPLHSKDFPFFASMLKSVETYLPCFKDLVVIVPPESADEVGAVVPSWAKIYVVPEPLPEQFGYLSQQVIKLYSDKFTTGDYVFILEADLVFTDWKDECFFGEGGKVRAYCMSYDEPDKTDPIWKKGTEHALWRTVEYDCVINTPFIFPRDVFPNLRRWITEEVHKKPLDKFMEDYYEGHSKGWTPDDKLFSEFNILNHYMLNFMPDDVEMVKTSDQGWEERHCSNHINVQRNHDLENPKLTSEFFQIAYKQMNIKRDDVEEKALDLSQ